MTVSRDEIKEALGKMPVLDLVELIKELEDEWDLFTAGPSKLINVSSNHNGENNPGRSSVQINESSNISNKGRINYNNEDEEDGGGVALQYIALEIYCT